MDKRKVQVGDKLFVEFNRPLSTDTLTVKKVARKYFYLGYNHNDLLFGISDWEPHPDNLREGKLYESEEAYKAEKEASRRRGLLIASLRRFVEWNGPCQKAPLEALEAAAKALGIEVDYDYD